METTKINYRIEKTTHCLIAVFTDKLSNGKYAYYDLYGDFHGEIDELFIREKTKNAKGYNFASFNDQLRRRGYHNIVMSNRMIY
jgi:hypothetical protein